MINLARADFQPQGSVSILTSMDRIAVKQKKKPVTAQTELHQEIRDWRFGKSTMLDSGGLTKELISNAKTHKVAENNSANYGFDSILVDDVGHKAKAIDSDHLESLETANTEKGEKSQNQQGQQQDQKDDKKQIAEMRFEIDIELRAAHELAHALNQLDDRDIRAMRRILKNPMNAFKGMARKICYLVFPPALVWDTLFAFRSAASFPLIERAVRAYEHCVVIMETHRMVDIVGDQNKDALKLIEEMTKKWKRVNPLLKTGWLND